MREFIDKDRPVVMKYYDVAEGYTGRNRKKTVSALKSIIAEDPYFLDAYVFLSELAEEEGEVGKAKELIEAAYKKALELIVDEKGTWPDVMEWGWLENRPIIRTLIVKGLQLWEGGEGKAAYGLFERLLKMNSNDNAGARYYMLGILTGMNRVEYRERFEDGAVYVSDLIDWFREESVKYPEAFEWWIAATRE